MRVKRWGRIGRGGRRRNTPRSPAATAVIVSGSNLLVQSGATIAGGYVRTRAWLLPLTLIAFILFGGFIGFILRAQEGAPLVPLDPQTAAVFAEPWVVEVAREHPWIATLLVVVGLLRTVFKSLRAFLPSSTTNQEWTAIQHTTWYRALAWILDFGASIRIPVPPASRSRVASPAAIIDRGAASLLAPGCVFLTACAVSGCASFTTTQIDRRNEQLGTAEIETRVSGRTLFTSKSQLANFKAQQTERSQGASVGSLTQESSGTNAVRALEALDSILGKIR